MRNDLHKAYRERWNWDSMNADTCTIYLRLSDGRVEDALEGREKGLRAEAARLGWTVHRVVIENDVSEDGRLKPASAFKTRRVETPSGKVELRTVRPRFRNEILPDVLAGRNLLCEDLDRVARDHRDLADILDAAAISGASVRSLSGSLTITKGGTDAEISQAWNLINFKNMESRDKARRVSDARQRHAGLSYSGGIRPFGYIVDDTTVKYHRNLIIVPEEAKIIREVTRDLLDRGISLAAAARDLRDRKTRTVTGCQWTPKNLKDALIKPMVAGLAVKWVLDDDGNKVRTLVNACWEPILDRDLWEKLVDFLTDPGRKTTTGNEPRWLLSKIATCECGASTRVSGPVADKRIQCDNTRHMSKSVWQVERHVTALILARLSQPDVKDLLKPPPRQGIDTGKLRSEARKLRERRRTQMKLHAEGLIEDQDLTVVLKQVQQRLTLIETVLAESDQPDPLAEFRDKPADVVWASLPIARKRAVVKVLMDVQLVHCKHRGPVFNPDGIRVTWKVPAAA